MDKANYITGWLKPADQKLVGKAEFHIAEELARNDPDKQYFCSVPNRREGRRTFDERKFRELYEKYIINPCKQFLSIDNKWVQLYNFYKQWIDESEEYLSRFDERFKICEIVVEKKEEFFVGFDKERIVVCDQKRFKHGWH